MCRGGEEGRQNIREVKRRPADERIKHGSSRAYSDPLLRIVNGGILSMRASSLDCFEDAADKGMSPAKKYKISNQNRNLLDEGKSRVPAGATTSVCECNEPSPISIDCSCNNNISHTNADQCATDNGGADSVSDSFEIAKTTCSGSDKAQHIQQ